MLGVRPENVRLSDASPLRGEVFGAEYLGTTQIVTITTKGGRLKARLPSTVSVAAGEQVGLTFRPEKLSIFRGSDGKAVRSALHEGELAREAAHG